MKRKHRRLLVVALAMLALASATGLVLAAFSDNLVFFYSPSDVVAKDVPEGRRIRVGGLVEEGSLQRLDDRSVTFRVTDLATVVPVVYRGQLPDLFREGQGVVTEGTIGAGRVFQASTVLAKHDETYMPPEVAESLKKAGHWNGSAPK